MSLGNSDREHWINEFLIISCQNEYTGWGLKKAKARLYYFFLKFTRMKIGNKIQQIWKIEWDKKKKLYLL